MHLSGWHVSNKLFSLESGLLYREVWLYHTIITLFSHAHSTRNSFSDLNHEKLVGLLEIRPTNVRGPTKTTCPQEFPIL